MIIPALQVGRLLNIKTGRESEEVRWKDVVMEGSA